MDVTQRVSAHGGCCVGCRKPSVATREGTRLSHTEAMWVKSRLARSQV